MHSSVPATLFLSVLVVSQIDSLWCSPILSAITFPGSTEANDSRIHFYDQDDDENPLYADDDDDDDYLLYEDDDYFGDFFHTRENGGFLSGSSGGTVRICNLLYGSRAALDHMSDCKLACRLAWVAPA